MWLLVKGIAQSYWFLNQMLGLIFQLDCIIRVNLTKLILSSFPILYLQLYPSEESGMMNGLVRQLQRFLLYNRQEKLGKEYNTISNIKNNHRRKGPPLHTAVMHSLLLGLEKFYATNSNKAYMNGDDQELSDSYEDSNIPK